MKSLRRSIWVALILGGIASLTAFVSGFPYVALGVLLAVMTGCFSLFTIGILCSGVSGDQHPHKSRRLAILWLIVKLPVIAALIMLAGRLGPSAERSFIWTIGLVYSLLLCMAWLENRAPQKEMQNTQVTGLKEQDDTEPS